MFLADRVLLYAEHVGNPIQVRKPPPAERPGVRLKIEAPGRFVSVEDGTPRALPRSSCGPLGVNLIVDARIRMVQLALPNERSIP
jgi:hypothetical protein